jgi:hypothetical protein
MAVPANQHKWETTRIAAIVGVIAILGLQTLLTRDPVAAARQAAHSEELLNKLTQVPTLKSVTPIPASDAAALDPSRQVTSRPSDPGEVIVGPSGISNRYKLQHVDRRKESANDVLVVSLHVESLATEGLVSPLESAMFEISSPNIPPIKPSASFRSPVPSGNSRNQDIEFSVPSTLTLAHAVLRIHYYNYENEIPLISSGPSLPMTTQATAPGH